MPAQKRAEAVEGNELTLKRVRHGVGMVGADQAFATIVTNATGVLTYEDLLEGWAAALLRIVELERERDEERDFHTGLLNDLSVLMPERYDGEEAAEVYVLRWANDVAALAEAARRFRNQFRKPVSGFARRDALCAAVDKIYPPEVEPVTVTCAVDALSTSDTAEETS